jgi:3-phenylpropionate/trans-cinnamate dioxygenase ferredoxin subunit
MTSAPTSPAGRRYVLFAAGEVQPGGRRIVQVNGRSVGVFNVGGRFYALLNRCPHKGARLCEGRVCGTTLPTDNYSFEYGRDGELVRCPWHGWEFDIATGQALAEPRVRVRVYPVDVQDGQVVITM